MEIIRIKANMSDPLGRMIPRGVKETITIEIGDEVAIFYFKDSRTTKRFAELEIEADSRKGKISNTAYIERLGRAVTKYPGKTKEEIKEILLKQLNQLNLSSKIKG